MRELKKPYSNFLLHKQRANLVDEEAMKRCRYSVKHRDVDGSKMVQHDGPKEVQSKYWTHEHKQ